MRLLATLLVFAGAACGETSSGGQAHAVDGSAAAGGAVGHAGASGEAGSAGSVGAVGSGGNAATGGAGGGGKAGAMDGGGTGGSAGVKSLNCTPDSGATQNDIDPATRKTISGTNGSFTDSCDGALNLLEYSCKTIAICSDPPNPSCTYVQTGEVISQPFDCGGTCKDGACASRCPAHGDTLSYLSVAADGGAKFRNESDGRVYECQLIFDAPNDAYDCKTGPTVGQRSVITSLGLRATFCTGGEFGNLGIGGCSYACRIAI